MNVYDSTQMKQKHKKFKDIKERIFILFDNEERFNFFLVVRSPFASPNFEIAYQQPRLTPSLGNSKNFFLPGLEQKKHA